MRAATCKVSASQSKEHL